MTDKTVAFNITSAPTSSDGHADVDTAVDPSFYRGCMKSNAELGTIVGPNGYGELLVARRCLHENKPDQDGRRDFWTATRQVTDVVCELDHSPRSMTEIKMRGGLK